MGAFVSADRWKGLAVRLGSVAVIAVMLVLIFRDGLTAMVGGWSQPEYSHGYLIPVVTLFFFWRDRHVLAATQGGGAWSGLVIVVAGLSMFLMGELGTIYTVVQYAFLVTLFGIVLAYVGWTGMRVLWIPMLYLVFMIPLPSFLYNGLSSQLQLISSQLGVAVIRWFDISVFLDGNVIDLGVYKLQVVEACSGLRYLFPLMSFGFLCAYLYQGPYWQKAVFFLLTIPITIFMNAFRIGVIGVLVEYYGIDMAEGFLHNFEGWFIFMACLAILLIMVWLVMRLSGMRGSLFDRFQVESTRPASAAPVGERRVLPRPYMAVLGVIVLAAAGTAVLGERAEAALNRKQLATLPMRIDDWRGRERALERAIVTALKVDDYTIVDYERPADPIAVNFYVAYYDSQRKGEAVHSPQSCIPGDGWRIETFSQRRLDGVSAAGQPLEVNRVVISKGELQQLVYYWFPQRDRFLTNEYWVKWYIFWDALTRNRTDGALVRLVTPVIGSDGFEAADRRLTEFAAAIIPKLPPYFPQ